MAYALSEPNARHTSTKKTKKTKKKRGMKKSMKIITINLPERYLEAIQTLNDLGVYPSRSEALRAALRDFLAKELKWFHELEDSNFRMLIRSREAKQKA